MRDEPSLLDNHCLLSATCNVNTVDMSDITSCVTTNLNIYEIKTIDGIYLIKIDSLVIYIQIVVVVWK